jgi:hypothetical protein
VKVPTLVAAWAEPVGGNVRQGRVHAAQVKNFVAVITSHQLVVLVEVAYKTCLLLATVSITIVAAGGLTAAVACGRGQPGGAGREAVVKVFRPSKALGGPGRALASSEVVGFFCCLV